MEYLYNLKNFLYHSALLRGRMVFPGISDLCFLTADKGYIIKKRAENCLEKGDDGYEKLGFGLMRLPLLDPEDERSIDVETVKKMADAFLSAGFTYFDTAACYHDGQSEIAFREAVAKRYPRDAYTITDKLTMFMLETEEDMPGFFAGQLERLGVDFIDYYWLHGLDPNAYPKAQELHAFDFVRRLKEEGKVKHIGFSFHGDAKMLEEILTRYPYLEYVQIQLNYLDWEDPKVQSRLCYETAARHGKPVIVMEPVKAAAWLPFRKRRKNF